MLCAPCNPQSQVMDQQSNEARTTLTSSNQFELLLFRLGTVPGDSAHELYGINVFKVREILTMPVITPIVGASRCVMGAVNIRGQIIPVVNLPQLMGCEPTRGLNILLVTEFARTTQGFAVQDVDDIVRLDWNQVLPAESAAAGSGLVTSIARIDGNTGDSRLAQVVDVEQVLRDVLPAHQPESAAPETAAFQVPPGTRILAADDSGLARTMIQQALADIGAECIMAKTGEEAWQILVKLADEAKRDKARLRDNVSMVLTDLEMPEVDGFTLTRRIRADERTRDMPVVIHSSLTGAANEAHVRNAGANGYVAKFQAAELAEAIRSAIGA